MRTCLISFRRRDGQRVLRRMRKANRRIPEACSVAMPQMQKDFLEKAVVLKLT